MLPAGFLGSRGDVLIDLVILSFAIILPLLIFSWFQARCQNYGLHRRLQLGLALLLAVAVVLFEIDLKLSGGIFALTRESAYADTAILIGLIYGHTAVAVASVVVWAPLLVFSIRRFGNPLRTGDFGRVHRFWGRTGMVLMMASGLSAMPLYYLGFVL